MTEELDAKWRIEVRIMKLRCRHNDESAPYEENEGKKSSAQAEVTMIMDEMAERRGDRKIAL
jgi:hypothetical protein